MLQNLADLWSYDVLLSEVDATGTVLKEHAAQPRPIVAAPPRREASLRAYRFVS